MEPPQVTLRSLLLPTQLHNSGAITPRNTSSSPIWATCKYICQFFNYATPQVSICFFGRDEQIIANFCKIVSKRETQSPEKSTYTLNNSGPVTKVRPPRQFGPHFEYICHNFSTLQHHRFTEAADGEMMICKIWGVNPKGTQITAQSYHLLRRGFHHILQLRNTITPFLTFHLFWNSLTPTYLQFCKFANYYPCA